MSKLVGALKNSLGRTASAAARWQRQGMATASAYGGGASGSSSSSSSSGRAGVVGIPSTSRRPIVSATRAPVRLSRLSRGLIGTVLLERAHTRRCLASLVSVSPRCAIKGGFRGALTGFAFGLAATSAWGIAYVLSEYQSTTKAIATAMQELEDSTQQVCEVWPGCAGVHVHTSFPLTSCIPASSPCPQAYASLCADKGPGRQRCTNDAQRGNH